MFDIGFWELMLIGVVALVVIGPERLPGVARTAGMWLGKARKFVVSVKSDIDRELKAEELKRIIEQQAQSMGVHEIIEETREAARDIKGDVEKTARDAEHAYLVDAIPDEPEPEEKPQSTLTHQAESKPMLDDAASATIAGHDTPAANTDEPAKN